MSASIAWAALGAIAVGLSLGIFGSGGSILTVPVLTYLLHHESKVAIAESLGIVGAIALIGAIPYARDRLVDWRTAVLFGVPGMLGTLAGAWIAGLVPGYAQMIVFGLVMATAAVSMWRRSAKRDTPDTERAQRRPPVGLAGVQGIGVGVMTGFVGVGGGFLIVPALVMIAGLPMRRAVATSLVVITMNCVVGLAKHHHALTDAGVSPDWAVIAVFIAVGGLGSFMGRRIQAKIDQRALRRGFAAFLLVVAAVILVRETTAMARQAPAPSNQVGVDPASQP